MSTVTQTPRGWSFIFKGQRYERATREQAQELLYDLQHGREPANDLLTACLDCIDELEAHEPKLVFSDDSRPIRVEKWVGEESTWLDFKIGEGTPAPILAGVGVGSNKPGLDLIICGSSLNEGLDEVWTLDDLRWLRDGLDALLRDERFTGAVEESLAAA